MTLQHHVTRSSMISAIDYDTDNKLLILTFAKNDVQYEYEDVPEKVYKELLAADSIGKYFLANIKDQYKTKKVDNF